MRDAPPENVEIVAVEELIHGTSLSRVISMNQAQDMLMCQAARWRKEEERPASEGGPYRGTVRRLVSYKEYGQVAKDTSLGSTTARLCHLEKQFGRDVAAAKALDVVFVEFALAAQDLGDDAGGAEDIGEVFLQEAVLVHEELEDF